jgi:hypothetical protein
MGGGIVKLWEIGDAKRSNLNAVAEAAGKNCYVPCLGNSSGFDAARGWNTLG